MRDEGSNEKSQESKLEWTAPALKTLTMSAIASKNQDPNESGGRHNTLTTS